jgi:hypothetical protein
MYKPVMKQHPSEAGAATAVRASFNIDVIQRAAERAIQPLRASSIIPSKPRRMKATHRAVGYNSLIDRRSLKRAACIFLPSVPYTNSTALLTRSGLSPELTGRESLSQACNPRE